MPDNDANGPEVFSPSHSDDNNVAQANQNNEAPGAPLVPGGANEQATITPSAPTASVDTSNAQTVAPVPNNAQPSNVPQPVSPSDPFQPITSGTTQSSAPFSPNGPMPGRKKKWLLPTVAVAAVLVLAGSFFGFKTYTSSANYVWNKAFANTATGYDTLSEKLASIEQNTYKNADVKGTLSLEGSGFSGSGDFTSSVGEKNGEGSFDFTLKSESEGNSVEFSAGADFKYVESDSKYPDIYVKARGLDKLKSLAASLGGSEAEVQPIIDQFNEKWYVLEGSYIEDQTAAYEEMITGGADAMSSTPTEKEVTDFLKSLSGSTKEYLLTSDKDKAVITQKEFVGKEQKNGRATYHYKAGVDKENLKAYGKELEKAFVASDLGKWAEKQSSQTAAELFDYEGFTEAVDDIDNDFAMDLWVDSDTKLIQTVRFYDETNGKTYADISLLYTGGNDVPFQVAIHDDSSNTDGKIKFTYNLDSGKVNFDFDIQAPENDTVVTWSSEITPRKDEPKVTAPTGATSIQELVNQYMGAAGSQLSQLESSYDASSDAELEALLNTYEN